MHRTLLTALFPALLALPATAGETPLPKLGPNAVSVTEDHAYFRTAPAVDYWAFSPYVKPQFTTSACSIAAVTAAVNGLSGLPALAEDTVMTQQGLLELTGLAEWETLSAEGGDGVTFEQLRGFTVAALAARGMGALPVTSWKPAGSDTQTLATLRGMLAGNEAGADDAMMVYFNQGVVTGDWDGPHVALIGAFDARTDRVLILEVDQEWYVPYWTPTAVLLDAMVKPTSDEHGVLEGETGGLVQIGN